MAKKTLIIGIDGLPYDLLNEMIGKGHMAGLRGILDGGYKVHRMFSTLPDLSSVAWTSFMTGVNPATHGIFGFTDLAPSSYKLVFPNAANMKAPPFWRRLRAQNKIQKTGALNIPNTFPAFPIDGLLVSGFVSLDFDKSVFPVSYLPYLKSANYVVDVDAKKAHTDKQGYYDDLMRALSIREEVYLSLFEKEPWDMNIFVITETDRLQHFMFDRKDNDLFLNLYAKVDTIVSRLYATAKNKWGDDFLFLILSDHGFTRVRREFNINALLQKAGMLKIDETKEFYERVGEGSRAFALDPGRIYINYEGKYPRGCVSPAEGPELRQKLKGLLFGLRDEKGTQVMQYVLDKEQLYSGPFLERAADLVCVARRGYDLKGTMWSKDVVKESAEKNIFTGMHTWDNAVFIVPESVKIDGSFNIEYPAKVIMDYYAE